MKDEEIKLNLGSGGRHLKEYISIDLQRDVTPKHDKMLIGDCRKLPFEENSVSKIFSSHLIEHFPYYEIVEVLSEWHRVLKEGGTLDIWTPDWDVIKENDKMDWVNWRLYAGRYKYEGAWHKAMFNFKHLKTQLVKAGFKHVKRIPKNSFPFKGVHTDMNMGVRAIK